MILINNFHLYRIDRLWDISLIIKSNEGWCPFQGDIILTIFWSPNSFKVGCEQSPRNFCEGSQAGTTAVKLGEDFLKFAHFPNFSALLPFLGENTTSWGRLLKVTEQSTLVDSGRYLFFMNKEWRNWLINIMTELKITSQLNWHLLLNWCGD